MFVFIAERKKRIYVLAGIALIGIVFAIILFGRIGMYKFPEKDDFLLKATISSTNVKTGDEISIKGVFRNLTDRSYKLYSDASFSKSGLMHIYVYKLNEEEMIFVGCERFVDIGPKQEIAEEMTRKMTEKGKYKVVISSNIEIKNPKNKMETRKYNLSAEKIYIEIE